MSDYLSQIAGASNWAEYYEAHKAVYRRLLASQWAFGAPSFAQQLHHTAIPDASGTTANLFNWAVYSQPSSATLTAFIPIFASLLRSEPHRVRSSRYLFVVTTGEPVSDTTIRQLLGDLDGRVDFWTGSLERVLVDDDVVAMMIGAGAMLDGADGIVTSGADRTSSSIGSYLQATQAATRDALALRFSVVPLQMRMSLLDSSFVLLCFRADVPPVKAAELIGLRAGIAALVARERARSSDWGHTSLAYCDEVAAASEPAWMDYVVQPGDILSRIVRRRFEMPYEHLWPLIRALNPDLKDPNLILSGQTLRLPALDV